MPCEGAFWYGGQVTVRSVRQLSALVGFNVVPGFIVLMNTFRNHGLRCHVKFSGTESKPRALVARRARCVRRHSCDNNAEDCVNKWTAYQRRAARWSET